MDHGTARARFDRFFTEEIQPAQKRALVRALADEPPTVGDLLSCLDGSAVLLSESDPLTIGEVLGCGSAGPRVVDVLADLGLPLDSPLDAAQPDVLGRLLSDLLPPSNG